MDRLYIERHQIPARYLAGQLSDEEAQAFERAFLADPSLVDDLELTARLRAGMAELDKRGELATFKTRRVPSLAMTPYAMAASVVAAVGLATSSYLFQANRDQDKTIARLESEAASFSGPQVISQQLHLELTRGEDAEIALRRGGDTSWTALSIDPGSTAPPRVSITLKDSAGRELWRVPSASPARNGIILLNVNATKMPTGRYVLEVFDLDGRLLQQYPLTVSTE